MKKNRNHVIETIHIFNNLKLWIKIRNANFSKCIYILDSKFMKKNRNHVIETIHIFNILEL
jgi:hypothetical protein